MSISFIEGGRFSLVPDPTVAVPNLPVILPDATLPIRLSGGGRHLRIELQQRPYTSASTLRIISCRLR